MKKLCLLVAVATLFLLFNAGNTFAFIWYYGDNPNADYEVVTPPVYDLFIPITVFADKSEYEKVSGLAYFILKDGEDPDLITWRVSVTNHDDILRMYTPYEIATSYPLRLIGFAQDPNNPQDTVLPYGVYEPQVQDYRNTLRGYVCESDGTQDGSSYRVYSSNTFKITVVPIPGTGLLLGTALVGIVGLRRKARKYSH